MKPTGLYNAMLARVFHMRCGPCCGIRANRIPAIAPCDMATKLEAMIQLWRVKWHQPDMPFLIVQLPKFDIDAIEDGGWPLIPRTGMERRERT